MLLWITLVDLVNEMKDCLLLLSLLPPDTSYQVKDVVPGTTPLREGSGTSPVDKGPNMDSDTSSLASDDLRVCMESFSASWSYRNDRKVLHDITFEVNRVSLICDTLFDQYCHLCSIYQTSRLLAVVGPVGSGKVSHHRYNSDEGIN